MNTTKHTFKPDYAVAPGETLLETMKCLGIEQEELSTSTGLTVQSLIRIFKGEQPLSHDVANRLESAVGIPASMWNKLETQYQLLAQNFNCKKG